MAKGHKGLVIKGGMKHHGGKKKHHGGKKKGKKGGRRKR
jgi:hypothetical protein